MKSLKTISIVLVACAIALTLACSDRPPKAPDIAGDIRHSLDQAGLNEVSVSQDRDKSVVTLTGKVARTTKSQSGIHRQIHRRH